MPQFKAIFVARSDGLTSIKLPNGRSEENAPTADQLSRELKTDKSGTKCYDYYRKLNTKDAKHVDWRIKLGAMWASARGTDEMKQRPTDYILADLPENYILYEHIKSKPDDAPKTKTHAGGGHDRQDAYLYGYPQGRRKRYRSPAEFIHHLLYLTDDNATDWQDCACKFCAPDDIQPKKDRPQSGSFVGVVIQSTTPPPTAKQSTQNASTNGPLVPQVSRPMSATNPTASVPPQIQPSIQPRISTTPIPYPQSQQQPQQISRPSSTQQSNTQPPQVAQTAPSPVQQSYTQPPQMTQAASSPVQAWIDSNTLTQIQKSNPQVYQIYSNLLMNRWQGDNRVKALEIISRELTRLLQMGFEIPTQTIMGMRQTMQINTGQGQIQQQQSGGYGYNNST